MADKLPVKANFTGADVTSLGEFADGDTVPVASGGTGAATAAGARANLGAQTLNATLTAISDGTLGAFSHRNKIINGNFAINQRGYVSAAATAVGQYTFDRWKVTATSGITFSTTANKTTVTIPAGQTIQQVIEGLNLQSGTYVLSWEGTAQGRVGAGAYGASGAVTASITGGTATTIEFNAGTVTNVQYEPGSVAQSFEHRHIGTELALCKWYGEKITFVTGLSLATGLCDSATAAIYAFPFTEKRAIPTITFATAASDFTARVKGGSVVAGTEITAANLHATGAIIVLTVASGLIAGEATTLRAASASASIFIDAEL